VKRVGKKSGVPARLAAGAMSTITAAALVAAVWRLPLPADASEATSRTVQAAVENNAGVGALKIRKYDAAIVHLRAARSLDPGNATVLRNLVGALNARAREAADAGQPADAERDYLEALDLDPDDQPTIEHAAAFFNNRAVAFMRRQQWDLARAYFARTLRYLPRVSDTTVTQQIRVNYASFLADEGDAFARADQLQEARARYGEALRYDPRNLSARVGLADLDYDGDEYAAALTRYREALDLATDPAHATLRSAITERVDTLRKEMAIEADFLTIHDQAGRFRLYFPRDLPPGAAAQVLQTLNEAYEKVGRDFDCRPRRALTVKIYSRSELTALQQIPPWVVGLFDGKIRLLDERLLGSTAQLRRSIFHEYTHAIIYLRGGDAVPSWLHEGLAQLETPDSAVTERDIRYVATRVRTRQAATLDELSRPFDRNQSGERVSLIYFQSRLLADFLLRRGGWEKMRLLLSEAARRHDFEAAFSATFGMSTAQMESEWKRGLLERDDKGPPK